MFCYKMNCLIFNIQCNVTKMYVFINGSKYDGKYQ